MTIALAGNPNCGKTTLFNALTGSNQIVGNWPGVTVEKKTGRLKAAHDVNVVDLPGIYSLSPYTPEEVISRDFIIGEKPDVIFDVIDGTNLERNLFLTTQLLELGVPVLCAVNMSDIVEKSGDKIDIAALERSLGCPVIAVSALKGTGLDEAVRQCRALCEKRVPAKPAVEFNVTIEDSIKALAALMIDVPPDLRRFYAIKTLENDDKIKKEAIFANNLSKVSAVAERLQSKLASDDGGDAESVFTEERYNFIGEITCKILKKANSGGATISDKIDNIVTDRVFALPIFAAVIFLIYFVSVSTVGTWVTDWTNDGLFGESWSFFGLEIPGIPSVLGNLLEAAGTAEWLNGLILDGIVAGVGAVIGFVPQMFVLFTFLAFLEASGYMARIAFILDRVFRRFGLSGKSFIPMLIGTGCGIPGVMASRTIENQGDRRMTIMTTTFMPCGAKLPLIALISGAVMGGAWWVAPTAYFLGIFAVILSGLILKKTRPFAGEAAPFVMELPAYHLPTAVNIARSVWERGRSFVQKAGSIILVSAVAVWFLSNFGFRGGSFGMVENLSDGLLAAVGTAIAPIFAPLGFGRWDAAVATITGLVAKENIVGTMGVLYGFAEVAEDGAEMWSAFAAGFTTLSGFTFLVFNLFCPPCFAAIGAIKREMNNTKWFAAAIGYQFVYGYSIALVIYQFGMLFSAGTFTAGTGTAVVVVLAVLYMLFSKPYQMRVQKASV